MATESHRLWINGLNGDLLIENNNDYRDTTRRGKDFSYHSTGKIESAGLKSAKVYALRWLAGKKDVGIGLEIQAEATAMLAFIAFSFSTASCFTLAMLCSLMVS
jgi:hypothetical protein